MHEQPTAQKYGLDEDGNPDRDAIASELLACGDASANGDELADVIDLLTMHPDARRKVVRMLAEIDASY